MKEGQKTRIDSIVDRRSLKDHGQGNPVLEERRSLESRSITGGEANRQEKGEKLPWLAFRALR
jgi:hypothetical protein